jgi:uncharacterized protein
VIVLSSRQLSVHSLDAYMQCIYNMDVNVRFDLRGQTFEWDSDKAVINMRKHNVAFQEACEVFFDPFFCLTDADADNEARTAAVGYTERSQLLFVVHVVREGEVIRIISARLATTEERKIYEHE